MANDEKYRNLQDIVLGAMLREPDCIDLVSTDVFPKLFTGDNKKIYGHIVMINSEGERPDIVRVANDLDGQVDAGRIAELTSASSTSANIEHYVNDLAKEYRRRQAVQRLKNTVEALAGANGNSDAIIEALASDLTKALDRSGVDDESLDAIAAELIKDIKFSYEHPGELPGISTGIRRLDSITKGLQPGQLWIIGAFTSVGKSALQQQMAGYQAADGVPVAYLTLEMSGKDTLLRITAQLRRINMMQLQYPSSPEQWESSNAAITSVAKLPTLHIRETSGVPIDRLGGLIRRMVRLQGVKTVYVDYVNLIPGTDRSTARYLELAEISRTLKQIALKLDICIVGSAQLGRDAGGRTPTLRDIRESMNLAFDADIVLLLHRERIPAEYEGAGNVEVMSDKTTLQVEKNRNGPVAPVPLVFHSGYLRFDEAAP